MAGWSEGDVTAQGIKIHYHRTGNNDKPAILLLHGITDNGLCWSRVARDLEDAYDVIMTDARGHGRSDGVAAGFSVELLAGDAAAVIQGLGLPSPYVYGHSMGAITAALLAARYSDLVRAIILEDPPLIDELPAALREGQEDDPAAVRLGLRALPREELIARARAANPSWAEEEIIPWAESKLEYDLGVLQGISAFRAVPWRDVLSQIGCPILLMVGDPDRGAIVTPEVSRVAEESWSNGQVVRLDGAGHSIHRDRYDESMEAVRNFLTAH